MLFATERTSKSTATPRGLAALSSNKAAPERPSAPASSEISRAVPKVDASVPCPIARLPSELIAMVAGYLAPEDFFAMTHVCRAWRGLRGHNQVVRRVADHRRLGPPPLHSTEKSRALVSGDLAEDVRLEGALLTRLRQGPLVLGVSVTYQSYKFSPTFRYVLKKDRYAHETTLHRLGGTGLVPEPLDAWPAAIAVSFAPVGDALLVRYPAPGPVQRLALTMTEIIPRTIMTQTSFKVHVPIWGDHGCYLLFACSDGRVRAARERLGQWAVAVQDYLHAGDHTFMALSRDTKTVAISEDAFQSIAMYHRDGENTWRRLGAVEAPCCAEATISPLGRFVAISSCGGDRFYRVNPSAREPSGQLTESCHRAELVSCDEEDFACFRHHTLEVYRGTDEQHTDTIMRHHSAAHSWTSPFLGWLERHREMRVHPGKLSPEGGPGTLTLQCDAECGTVRRPNEGI